MEIGQITFYNSDLEIGKIVLDSGVEFDFSMDIWDDFVISPEIGKKVECHIENGVLKSLASLGDDVATTQKSSQKSKESDSKSAKLSATYDVKTTLKNYFSSVEGAIDGSGEDSNKNGQLDYFLSRRFLITSYNNLRSLDPSLHDHKMIKKKLKILQDLHKAYYTVTEKVGVTELAFEMIFLRAQPEYTKYLSDKARCVEGIAKLGPLINSLNTEIQDTEAEIKQTKSEKVQKELDKKLKHLRSNYVDAIDDNAKLNEELNAMKDIKAIYTDRYFKSFESELSSLSVQYKKVLTTILNHKAYDLDYEIWKQAGHSKLIKDYFKESGIEGDYSTKTFLRYYLKTLSKDKLKEEQKDLFKLLTYLEKSSE